ncbi:alpha-ketoglutarate-dependent dioxygenase AlkB [Xanthomonas sontii]|uniref:alpha-ketoglutarate-dependent dioxygenase AlkB n=1 Tax=Xanthomonas sontii TaxID=2650745 RepID=UPI0011E4394C|nr:alpha-ketoglutarate-dependent dioxygenase AlkB [Xanthomonas sontii]MDQ7759008.1 alpha-ketoglutarate-dependent dioxygenase AlkB [Xanthomonas sontii]TYD33914.1 2OG-Fe(II) oxygenase [Xanthomonas sontii]UZK07812.1 2OG-Fe(II) oxygenase [Xanthomonas sontii]
MQKQLFGEEPIRSSINGLVYQEEFLSEQEQQELIDIIRSLPLHAAQYKQYLARRKVVSFGGSYDFDVNRLLPGVALDPRLLWLRERVAQWIDVPAEELVHALLAEYAPGTPLGWHRDVPDFETIVGLSFGGRATLKFRPHPDEPATRKVVQLDVAPRSIYKMTDEARWDWQHSVTPTAELLWSITFRTRRS